MDYRQQQKEECQICGYRIFSDVLQQHMTECYLRRQQQQGNLESLINESRIYLQNRSQQQQQQRQEEEKLDMSEQIDCSSCGQKVKLQDLHIHENSCSNKESPCEYCAEKFPKDLMESHLEFCQEYKEFKRNFQQMDLQQQQQQQRQREEQQQQQQRQRQRQERQQEQPMAMPPLFQMFFGGNQSQVQQQHQQRVIRINRQSSQPQQQRQPDPMINVLDFLSLLSSQQEGRQEVSDEREQEMIRRNPSLQILRQLLQGGNLDNIDFSNNGGMSQESMSDFPVATFKEEDKNKPDFGNCSVCMDDYEVGQKYKILDCLHKYHVECIDEWLKKNTTCPVCKTDMRH